MVQTDFKPFTVAVVKTWDFYFPFCLKRLTLQELIWVVVSLVNLSCPQPISEKTLSNWEEISKFSLDKISKFGVNSCHLLWQRNAWHIETHCSNCIISSFIGSVLCLGRKQLYNVQWKIFLTLLIISSIPSKNGSNTIRNCNDLS